MTFDSLHIHQLLENNFKATKVWKLVLVATIIPDALEIFSSNQITSLQMYQFNMTCLNDSGDTLESDLLEFSTHEQPKLYQGWTSSDYLKEMNPALPAISKSIVHQSIASDSISLSTLSRSRQKTSPHAVLGK